MKRALLAAVFLLPGVAEAHEMDPGLLRIESSGPDRTRITWKAGVVSLDGLGQPIAPRLPDACVPLDAPRALPRSAGSVVTWTASCGAAELLGETIEIVGLENSLTDVLVILAVGDLTAQRILTPDRPSMVVEAGARPMDFVGLGIRHILEGFDHLLFVLGLLLLIPNLRMLLATITAFTVGHSFTLALATFELVRVPSRPVEAMIAVSIVLLAAEAARYDAGSLTRRLPWLVAIGFGLVHGLGFAGALAEVGLPSAARGAALLAFNVGVELGQLLFVAVLLAALALLARAPRVRRVVTVSVAPYAMGVLGVVWTCERLFV